MRKAVLFLLSVVVFPFSSLAYEVDTHFYGTYAMARFSGLRHEIAEKLALGAQWMDESYISDPLSMIVMPYTGAKKRRLLHFAGTEVAGVFNEHEDEGYKYITITRENHPIASGLFDEGLREGNLMKVAASLHVLEDSYAHASTSSQIGHAPYGHWPDRPFANVDKYKRMVETVFKAMVAIRKSVPESAIDKNLRTNNRYNYQMSAKELNDEFIPLIVPVIGRNILKEPEYIIRALSYILVKAKNDGKLIGNNFVLRRWLKDQDIDGQSDTRQILAKIIERMVIAQLRAYKEKTGERVINLAAALQSVGYSVSTMKQIDNARQSLGEDGFRKFIAEVVEEITVGLVPKQLSSDNLFEVESHNLINQTETQMKNQNMQAFIQRLFGVKIQFVGNNTRSDFSDFKKEVFMSKEANPIVSQDPNSDVIISTYSLKEKNQWNSMIFKYLFPSMNSRLDEVLSLFSFLGGILTFDSGANLGAYYTDLFGNKAETDLGTRDYQDEVTFNKRQREYKKLISESSLNELIQNFQKSPYQKAKALDGTGELYK